MKNNYQFLLKYTFCVLFFLLIGGKLSAQFSCGSGTVSDPYIIVTAEQLDAVRNRTNAHYRLNSNINLAPYLASGGAGYSKWGSAGWAPIPSFSGTLNGAGYKITGLWIDHSATSYRK